MIELERTFLAREVPKGLKECKYKEIIDIYIPKTGHPSLRVRKNGNKFEITKKVPIKDNDASQYDEQNIIITETEFNELNKLDGKKVRKIRYYYLFNGRTAEVDVFKDLLEGLILIDFEFNSAEEKDSFEIPDFCLAEVTQEEFIAGGMISGKSYKDIEKQLEKYGYRKLFLE